MVKPSTDFERVVAKKLKFFEQQLGDIWEKIAAVESNFGENVDEIRDLAERNRRAVGRIKKDFDEHEHEE